MAEFVVDTHALVWYLENNVRLGENARQVLNERSNTLYLPVTALAESLWMIENGRTDIPTVEDLMSDIETDPRIVVVALTKEIVLLTAALTGVGEMHDRQIVATTLHLSHFSAVSLITRDKNILDSGIVTVVW